jgi:CRP-like cAMP-binding protein
VLDRIRSNIARYVTLDDDEFDLFASMLRRRRLERKDPLLRPGEICAFEGFVDVGCLRVFSSDTRGADHVLYFAPEDWWVADIRSFVSETPAELGIDALEASEVLLIDRTNKERLYAAVPKFERLFRMMTQRALVSLQHRLIATMEQTAEARYRDFKRRYPGLEGRIPQYQIAAYLGVCPEFLSRLRRRREPSPGLRRTGILTSVNDRARGTR